MTTIIGYTDSVAECECCGKIDLKGTYCLEIDGVELYYGSVCAFKNHGVSMEDQKAAKKSFTKAQKNALLIEKHISPLKSQLIERLNNTFTTTYENLPDFAKKTYHQIEAEYQRCIEYRMTKYKITGA